EQRAGDVGQELWRRAGGARTDVLHADGARLGAVALPKLRVGGHGSRGRGEEERVAHADQVRNGRQSRGGRGAPGGGWGAAGLPKLDRVGRRVGHDEKEGAVDVRETPRGRL